MKGIEVVGTHELCIIYNLVLEQALTWCLL